MEQNTLNFNTGEKLETFLNGKIPHTLMFSDNENHPLNIIYFGDKDIPKAFALIAEQIVRPTKYTYLGKSILSTQNILTKPDPIIVGRTVTMMKKSVGRSILFNLSPIYQTFIHSFNNISKVKVTEGFEQICNSVVKDFNIKSASRKNIIVLNESLINAENIKSLVLGSSSKINSLLGYIRYLIMFNIELNINVDAIVFYNESKHLFYPLTLPKAKITDSLKFNRQILIRLLQDISPRITDTHLMDINEQNIQKTEILNETIPDDKISLKELLVKLENLTPDLINEKEIIIQEIKKITDKYPGQDLKEKLDYIFASKPEVDQDITLHKTAEKKISKTKGTGSTEKTGSDNIDTTIEEINRVYNGSILYSDIESNLIKQVFDPKKIVGLEEFSSINKQQTEMFEKLDENIRDLANAFTQDPDLKIEVLDIKSQLVETNKDRYIEYNVKIKHDFGIATKKPYTITFRVPAPIDEKYLKIGGNNYIMIQQLFPQPIQKVNNTTTRLYTHYNTTSVILKGSVLESKDFKNVEKEFIDSLVSAKLISRSKVREIDIKTKQKLIDEYNCPLSMTDLQYNFSF